MRGFRGEVSLVAYDVCGRKEDRTAARGIKRLESMADVGRAEED